MQGLRYIFYHLWNMWSHLRTLCNDCCIQIHDLIIMFLQQFSHMLQQFDTGNTFIFIVCIWEMFTNISQCSSSQQCIHNCM